MRDLTNRQRVPDVSQFSELSLQIRHKRSKTGGQGMQFTECPSITSTREPYETFTLKVENVDSKPNASQIFGA